jgi:hypothetical protein
MPAGLSPEGGGRRMSSSPNRVKSNINPRLRVLIPGRKVISSGILTGPINIRSARLSFLSA